MNPAVQVFTAVVDISSESQINDFIRGTVETFGSIHYAVNNAGITSNPRVRSHELPVESWDKVVNVNLRGTWLCQRAILGQMMKQERELETRYTACSSILSGAWQLMLAGLARARNVERS